MFRFLKKTPQPTLLAIHFPESFQPKKKTFLPTLPARSKEKMRPRFSAVLRLEFLSSKHENIKMWIKPKLLPPPFYPHFNIYNNSDNNGRFLKQIFRILELFFFFSKAKYFQRKKRVPKFFPLFAKKARAFLCIKLEKFVYTKTHLAVKIDHYFFRALKRKKKITEVI